MRSDSGVSCGLEMHHKITKVMFIIFIVVQYQHAVMFFYFLISNLVMV